MQKHLSVLSVLAVITGILGVVFAIVSGTASDDDLARAATFTALSTSAFSITFTCIVSIVILSGVRAELMYLREIDHRSKTVSR